MNLDKHITETLAEEPSKDLTVSQFKVWNLCKIYRAARPIVVPVLKTIRFFKKGKAKMVINLLIQTLDALCPETKN